MNLTMRSNLIKGEYKDAFMNKAINEIYTQMSAVYGPYASDIYGIKSDGSNYLTKDGISIFKGLLFDNAIAMKVKDVLLNAVNRQDEIGDGTTSMLLFYTMLYREYARNKELFEGMSQSHISTLAKDLIKNLKEVIKNDKVDMFNDTEEFRRMVYTIVKDDDITNDVIEAMKNVDKDTFLSVSVNDMTPDITVNYVENVLVKSNMIFTLHGFLGGLVRKAAVYYIGGRMSYTDVDTLKSILSIDPTRTIVILSSGITSDTVDALKIVKNQIQMNQSMYSNLIVMDVGRAKTTITNFDEDMRALFYDEPTNVGISSHIGFQDRMIKSLLPPNEDTSCSIMDIAPSVMNLYASIYENTKEVHIDIKEGISFDMNAIPPSAIEIRNAILEEMRTTHSPVQHQILSNRLRALFGKFVNISVGAINRNELSKRFELVKDGVNAAHNGLMTGGLKYQSFTLLIHHLGNLKVMNPVEKVYHDAMVKTVLTMMKNKHDFIDIDDDLMVSGLSGWLNVLPETPMNIHRSDIRMDSLSEVLNECFNDPIDGDVPIVEVVGVIESILDNSITPLDLFFSKYIMVDDLMNNNI